MKHLALLLLLVPLAGAQDPCPGALTAPVRCKGKPICCTPNQTAAQCLARAQKEVKDHCKKNIPDAQRSLST